MSNLYNHDTGTGKVVICRGPSILSKVSINSAVAAGTVKFYDYSVPSSATGPAGATGSVAIITTAAAPVTLPLDIVMKNGIVLENSPTGGVDVTVAYRQL